jgi:hypothetical protein
MSTRLFNAAQLALLLLPGLAAAAGQPDPRMVIVRSGWASDSCAKFNEAEKRRDVNWGSYMTWMQGLITGYNAYAAFDATRPSRDLGAGSDVVEWSAWLTRYCSEHPLTNFGDASFALIEALGGNSMVNNSKLYR